MEGEGVGRDSRGSKRCGSDRRGSKICGSDGRDSKKMMISSGEEGK